MRWEGGRQSGDIEDRRRLGPVGVGGIGVGGVVLALIGYFVFGISPTTTLNAVNQAGQGAQQQQEVAQGRVADREGQFVWGPNEIAFSTLSSNSYRFANISAIRPDGTGLRRLTHVAPRKTSGFSPVAWSDDGRRLLAGYYREGIPITYAIDAVHGGARVLARRVAPAALSHDGRVVIGETGNPFCCTNDPINVVRLPWTGGKPHILIKKAFGASSND